MLIVQSDYKDYYDGVAASGIDKTIVYRRVRAPLGNRLAKGMDEAIPGDTRFEAKAANGKAWVDLEFFLVGFCGRIYPGARLQAIMRLHPYEVVADEFYYDTESLVERLNEFRVKTTTEDLRPTWHRHWLLKSFRGNGLSLPVLERYFSGPRTDLEGLFHELKAPSFLLHRKCCARPDDVAFSTTNPCLRELGFQKVKDPYTAFQDLSVYISGVLGSESKPVIEVSDEVKAEAKGHGGEYSFRKPPGTKRGTPRWR
ncbi:MAG: hypothetical protein IT285_16155 [Bdellovibrionales bacterium]|nr:hypothetical protein [Bdellovibrionales bacterium]